MGALQGPIVCHISSVKPVGVNCLLLKGPLLKVFENELWGFGRRNGRGVKLLSLIQNSGIRRCKNVVCRSVGSSNDSVHENLNSDGDYINCSVVEAVEVKSGADGFLIALKNGKHLKCVHNNPQRSYQPDYSAHPAIVLRMEDGSNLLLPIIVLEMPSMLLMAAVKNVQMARPSLYQVMKDMIVKMGYTVKLVRVTKRVQEAYYAQLYLTKVGDDVKIYSFDLRPSDAINIAVRCKVPIQVNKYLAYNDGMRVLEPAKLAGKSHFSDGLLATELDRPDGRPCIEAEEFDIICNMFNAIDEERYSDAAEWRDMLVKFRSEKKQKWT